MNDPPVYLVTYVPLVASKYGREAARRYEIPPFVDGSIRREPDLEHVQPGISCLCRAGKFAPRLGVGDVVGYLTKKRRYRSDRAPHRYLTALLRVLHTCESHSEASRWYGARGLSLPSNCWVRGNPPKPIVESHRKHKDANQLCDADLRRQWDAAYRARAMKFGTFVICDVIFRELSERAPAVLDDHLQRAFGHVPGTQNPGALPWADLQRLLRMIGIAVPPFAP